MVDNIMRLKQEKSALIEKQLKEMRALEGDLKDQGDK